VSAPGQPEVREAAGGRVVGGVQPPDGTARARVAEAGAVHDPEPEISGRRPDGHLVAEERARDLPEPVGRAPEPLAQRHAGERRDAGQPGPGRGGALAEAARPVRQGQAEQGRPVRDGTPPADGAARPRGGVQVERAGEPF
jgi:hypothetical protein